MTCPARPKAYHEKDRLDLAIEGFAAKKTVNDIDMAAVRSVAHIEKKLDEYRAGAGRMSEDEMEQEAHRSARLGEHLALDGDPRPNGHCDAHAIVAGAHLDAAEPRAILARMAIRIDDPDNGCWLPRNTAALPMMPRRLRCAIPHSRIHRYNYYFWLRQMITLRRTPNQAELRAQLKMIEQHLQRTTCPPYVMMKKGEGLPT